MNDKRSGVAPTTDSGDEYAPADEAFADDAQGAANVAVRVTTEEQGAEEPGDQPAAMGPIQFVAPDELPEREPGEGQQ
jgi:hypothetical protein